MKAALEDHLEEWGKESSGWLMDKIAALVKDKNPEPPVGELREAVAEIHAVSGTGDLDDAGARTAVVLRGVLQSQGMSEADADRIVELVAEQGQQLLQAA